MHLKPYEYQIIQVDERETLGPFTAIIWSTHLKRFSRLCRYSITPFAPFGRGYQAIIFYEPEHRVSEDEVRELAQLLFPKSEGFVEV